MAATCKSVTLAWETTETIKHLTEMVGVYIYLYPTSTSKELNQRPGNSLTLTFFKLN